MYSSRLMAIAALASLGPHLVNTQKALATQCYFISNNIRHPSPGGPCGVVAPNSKFTSCCGIGETCHVNGICHKTHSTGSTTGYYVGGCTNPNWSNSPSSASSPKSKASSCNLACSDLDLTDIVYNASSNIWACCGSTNGVAHCENPSNENFRAPAPNSLPATYTVLSSASTVAAISSTDTSSPNSSSDNDGNGGRGLGSGAKAGIGVGAAVGILAVAGIGLLFLLRRRQRQFATGENGGETKPGAFTDNKVGAVIGAMPGAVIGANGINGVPIQEISTDTPRAEMEGQPKRPTGGMHELP